MLIQCFSFAIFIFFNVCAVDWRAVQSHGRLPNIFSNNCTIGKYYRSKCNVCECISPGIPKCGTLRCVDDNDRQERSGNVMEEGCAVGTVYRDWCNLCRCETGDIGMCTRMRCRQSRRL